MDFEVLRYSKTRVDRCARVLIDPDASESEAHEALEVVANWRSSHAFPLNTFQNGLRAHVKRVGAEVVVVQRLKRTRSIQTKLIRERSMRLTQMQDIGGCRAVLCSLSELNAVRRHYEKSRSQHKLVEAYDYIQAPKASGYRGIHLVYKFQSGKTDQYNGLMCEIQLRTLNMHAWATAVESVGAIIDEPLKASEGAEDWLEFFQYASQAISILESANGKQHQTSLYSHIAEQLARLGNILNVVGMLEAARSALKFTESKKLNNAAFYLLILRPGESQLEVREYSKENSKKALEEYLGFEANLPRIAKNTHATQLSLFPEFEDSHGTQAVLVGAESLKSVRQSFPNYYLDTESFITLIDRYVERYGNRRLTLR